mmetsp:Transcript_110697/g.308462  ORF Transcript_110697/g.308462 Transcript_110697/m.308462 type:complete len:112 (-) Transcript_110697:229-564(-)
MARLARVLLGAAFLSGVICKDPEVKDGPGPSENSQQARPGMLAAAAKTGAGANGTKARGKARHVVSVPLSLELQTLLQRGRPVVQRGPAALWPVLSRRLRARTAMARVASA